MTAKGRSLASEMMSALAVLLSIITIAQPYNNSPPIRSDGIGYHAWVHAIQRGSINFCEHAEILDSAAASSMCNQAENKCGNKYSPGVGITQAPLTLFLGSYDIIQGFSTPRARAGTIAYAAFCVLLMLIRPTNLLLVVASSAMAASNQAFSTKKKINLGLAGALALFLGLTFYLSYNFYHLGILTLSTYGSEKVVPMATHTLQVFLFYERGLFTYYPLTILLVSLGWPSKKRSIYAICIVVILGYGLIYGS